MTLVPLRLGAGAFSEELLSAVDLFPVLHPLADLGPLHLAPDRNALARNLNGARVFQSSAGQMCGVAVAVKNLPARF